jgi:hypothetical protein
LNDQRSTLPGGAIAVTPDGTFDSCCVCRGTLNSQRCDSGFVRWRNTNNTFFTTVARCCCGRPSGMRFLFGAATVTETYIDGPNPTGVVSTTYTYAAGARVDDNGNPSANGTCQLVVITVRQVFDSGQTQEFSNVTAGCPGCGGIRWPAANGSTYVTPPLGIRQDIREAVEGNINCFGASGSWSYSGGPDNGLTGTRTSSVGSWSYSIGVTQPCANC